MTLEQAIKRLAEKGMWFETPIPAAPGGDPSGRGLWVVMRWRAHMGPSMFADPYRPHRKGNGWTWQEAYAEAMGEAPF